MELNFLCTSYRLIMLYFCIKFRKKYPKEFQSYQADTIFILKFIKGHKLIQSVGRVMVLGFCTLSDSALYL